MDGIAGWGEWPSHTQRNPHLEGTVSVTDTLAWRLHRLEFSMLSLKAIKGGTTKPKYGCRTTCSEGSCFCFQSGIKLSASCFKVTTNTIAGISSGFPVQISGHTFTNSGLGTSLDYCEINVANQRLFAL